MDRRTFLQTSLFGCAAAVVGPAVSGLPSSCTAQKPAAPELKLSFQERIACGNSLGEKLDFMEKLGVVGLEVNGRNLTTRFEEIRQSIHGRNIKISAVCAGFEGFILAADPKVKTAFDTSMHELLAAAGELGALGVIMVPAFNRQTPVLPHTRETREFLCEELHALGEYALKYRTSVILEPLNRREAHYLRQVSDAAALCRDAKSEGIKCMGDFWHMSEETSDYAAFIAAGEYLRHVHIASRGRRKMPGEDGEQDNYISGMRALKELDYPYYISFECGTLGERAVTVPAAVELLRKQWQKA